MRRINQTSSLLSAPRLHGNGPLLILTIKPVHAPKSCFDRRLWPFRSWRRDSPSTHTRTCVLGNAGNAERWYATSLNGQTPRLPSAVFGFDFFSVLNFMYLGISSITRAWIECTLWNTNSISRFKFWTHYNYHFNLLCCLRAEFFKRHMTKYASGITLTAQLT